MKLLSLKSGRSRVEKPGAKSEGGNGVSRGLERDLAHLEKLAFSRAKHCGPLVRRFYEQEDRIEASPHAELIWNLHAWLLTPLSLWPVDFEGLSGHVLERVRSGEGLEEELVELLALLDEPPGPETQGAVAEFEHYVQSGGYEKLLKAPEKFEEQEKALLCEAGLQADWERVKKRFEVASFRNSRGVIRRRMSQERNLRTGWEFNWEDRGRRFHLFFDALCYRWRLYGMEQDRPLLLKVSVNPTPHGTMIVIPRHWSLDPHRDLDWKFIGQLHRAHGARRQGRKLSAGRMERMAEARKAKRLWAEARRKGLRGERRYEYVRERMGRDRRMGPGWLKRLLSGSNG